MREVPEGHVIHRLARELSADFAGQRVEVTSPQGRFASEANHLNGRLCEGAEAVGKHLFIRFDAPPQSLIHIHLGLIGKLRIAPAPPELATPGASTVRVRMATDAFHAELRGPQWCRLVDEDERSKVLSRTGPDPLRSDADPQRAWSAVHRTRRPIGAVLMDQGAFAGVGNIFRAEVLFRQRISPFVPAAALAKETFSALWDDLVVLMGYAVGAGRIDTVDPEHEPEAMGRAPRDDPHGGEVYVYRRAGQPCLVCGSAVRSEVLQGRNLYWCGTCQAD